MPIQWPTDTSGYDLLKLLNLMQSVVVKNKMWLKIKCCGKQVF